MCTYADAIERKGIEKGIEEGIERGIEKAEYRCFKNCMDRGMSLEDAKALSGAGDEDANLYYSRWQKEKAIFT